MKATFAEQLIFKEIKKPKTAIIPVSPKRVGSNPKLSSSFLGIPKHFQAERETFSLQHIWVYPTVHSLWHVLRKSQKGGPLKATISAKSL